ncbi:MAG: DUF421 domain-containing protein [Clostridiales bacterium]|nr:DUF421 domain-containing protein [Clostridiales bacterium]
MVFATALFAVHRDTGGAFRSGRAPTPQKDEEDFRSLSFTDNVPFGDTLRAKGYSYFCVFIIHLFFSKRKRLRKLSRIFFFRQAQNTRMGLIFIRTTIIFITLLAIMRMMGKRQIGEMQPYELVITLIISELACIPMADNSIPLLYGIIAILTVFVLHQIVCVIDLKFTAAKPIISGTPSIVLNKNGVDDSQLKKNNLNVSDLIESLRVEGIFSLDAVEYALYEAEGAFSALPKKGFESMQTSLPIILVNEGKFDVKNVEKTERNTDYYLDVLRRNGCKDEKKVLIMTVDGNGKVYLQKKGQRYKVIHLHWEKPLW